MSFTDEENKKIEDAEQRAEDEIRERFRNLLFQEEEPRPSGRVVKKVDVESGSNKAEAAPAKKAAAKKPSVQKAPEKKTAASKPAEKRAPAKKATEKRTAQPAAARRAPERRKPSARPQTRIPIEREPERDYTGIPETFYVRPGIQWFRQDIIPSAASELSRSDELNDRRRVRACARRVENSADAGTAETLRRAQVSYLSEDYSLEDCIIPERVRYDSRRLPPVPRDRRRLFAAVDNSKKAVKLRGRTNKPQGPGGKIATVVIILLVLGIAAFGFVSAKTVFDDAAMDPENLSKIEYTVTEATSDDEVAAFLVKNGMVESELMYKLRAKIFDADYVAGTYELSPSYSTEKIINILSGFDYSSGS